MKEFGNLCILIESELMVQKLIRNFFVGGEGGQNLSDLIFKLNFRQTNLFYFIKNLFNSGEAFSTDYYKVRRNIQ